MMKKNNLLILAVAALGFAACANDETTAVNEKLAESNAISFRANVTGNMRSADITKGESGTPAGTVGLKTIGFWVTAKYSTTENNESADDYFDNAHYVYNSTNDSYTCADKYYWPSEKYLNFYAYAPEAGNDLSGGIQRNSYKSFTIKPDQTASTDVQKDFVYASTMNQTKAANSTGVALQFHHAQSKVSLKVKNSSATMDFTITGNIQVCNVKRQGKFDYTGIEAGKLKSIDWNTLSDEGNYTQAQLVSAFAANASASKAINDLILVPQDITPASAYSGTTEGSGISTGSGSYILIPITIKQKNTSIVIYSGNAIWPLPDVDWVPGNHYTYTVDLAGGGYKDTNSDDGDTDLDPVLEGSEIIFTTVSVDEWTPESYIVGNMVFAAKTGGVTHTANIVKEAGVYTITVNNLTASEGISVSETNCTVTPASGTAGSDKTFTVTCTVTENTGSERTVTVIVTGTTSGATTINLTQAGV